MQREIDCVIVFTETDTGKLLCSDIKGGFPMVKKIGSVLAAIALVMSFSLAAFASANVTSIEDGVFVTDISYSSGDKFDVGDKISDIYENFSPGETINIFLDPSKFVGSELDLTPTTGMTARTLKSAGVDYKLSTGDNTQLIASHGFKEKEVNGNKVALIQIELVSNFSDTEAKSFETTLTLYANKVKQQSIKIGGEISSSEVEITNGDDYFYLGDGKVGVAKDNINNMEIDAGNNVSLFAKLIKDRKYYAVAKESATSSDIELINAHPELETVYQLSTKGFLENTEIKIKSTDKFYVYNENGKLLGTTDDRLPLVSKYFLATQEVSFGDGSDVPVDGDDVDVNEPALPDDSVEPQPGDTSGSGTDIPDTGISIAPQIAVVGAVVGLATIGVIVKTSRKK